MEVSRRSLNLMGIHANPSERIETDPASPLSVKDLWAGTKPVQGDFRVEQCAVDGGENFQFLAGNGDQHVLLRYSPLLLACSHF